MFEDTTIETIYINLVSDVLVSFFIRLFIVYNDPWFISLMFQLQNRQNDIFRSYSYVVLKLSIGCQAIYSLSVVQLIVVGC